MKKSFFVAGTNTDVGKTYVSHLLLQAAQKKGLSTLGLKPVAAGGLIEVVGEVQAREVAGGLVDLVDEARLVSVLAHDLLGQDLREVDRGCQAGVLAGEFGVVVVAPRVADQPAHNMG